MCTIDRSKDFIVRQIEKLSQDELAEVAQFIEFLKFRERLPIQSSSSGVHSAFGIWADYPEASDPTEFSLTLREKIETRRDDMDRLFLR